jgi:hypothetical protein
VPEESVTVNCVGRSFQYTDTSFGELDFGLPLSTEDQHYCPERVYRRRSTQKGGNGASDRCCGVCESPHECGLGGGDQNRKRLKSEPWLLQFVQFRFGLPDDRNVIGVLPQAEQILVRDLRLVMISRQLQRSGET